MTKLSFEQQVLRLDQIVAILDKGTAPIEELLQLYQEGMELAQLCRKYLAEAEQRVVLINNQTSFSKKDDSVDELFDDEFDQDLLPNSTVYSLGLDDEEF
jgi:exodeoxyribonuclease VII small subunit